MKKIISFIIINFILIIPAVQAKKITIDEIVTEFPNSKIAKQIGFTNYLIKNDTGNKAIIYYDKTNNKELTKFTYTDDYIEFTSNVTVTKDNIDSEVEKLIYDELLENILSETIFKLSGSENKYLKNENVNSYEEDGLILNIEKISFSGEEDTGSWSITGEQLKHYKISLDTDKISKIITKYTTDTMDDVFGNFKEAGSATADELTPTIRADNITENSATVYAKVDKTGNETIYCNIYRSDSKDGEYKQVSVSSVNCSDGVGLVDKDLQSGKTYYYKTKVTDGTKYSEILEVTTKTAATKTAEEETDTKEDKKTDEIENPETGNTLSSITMLILFVSGILAIIYS